MGKKNRSRGPSATTPSASQEAPSPTDDGSRVVAAAGVAAATAGVAGMSVGGGGFGTQLAAKMPAGTLGRPIRLKTNFFSMTVEDTSMFHYDVSFKAERKKSAGSAGDASLTVELPVCLGREVFEAAIKQFSAVGQDFFQRNVVFDGRRNMYSMNQRLTKNANRLSFTCQVALDT